MDFIEDYKPNFFRILPIVASGNTVPFFRSRNYDISLGQALDVGSEVTAQLYH